MNVFFDLDGTLTDPAVGITRCLAHALRASNAPCPDRAVLERYIGPPLRDAFAELLPAPSAEAIERAVTRYRERFGDVGLFENELYPHVIETLARLRAAEHRLWIVTSKPHVYARRILDHFELTQHFAGVFGAELGGANSDKATLVGLALDASGAPAARACMVGDREHDMRGARHHGIVGVGVLWGYGSAAELESAGASHLLSSMVELGAVLDGLDSP